MIAAVIAVVGALIVFAGVWRTTGTTRKENRRAENVAVLTDAAGAMQDLTRAIDCVASADSAARVDRVTEMNAGPMKDLGDKYTMAATKLELYGFDAAAEQTQTLEDKLIAVWDGLRKNPASAVDFEPCLQDFHKALTAIKDARKKLR